MRTHRLISSLAAFTIAFLCFTSAATALTYPVTAGNHRITKDNGTQLYPEYPSISGLKVVWAYTRNHNSDIYCYDLAKGTRKRLTYNTAFQDHPKISGSRVVYEDYRDGHHDVYCYDLATSRASRLTTDTNDHTQPSISGDRVVYSAAGQVYCYDFTTSQTSRLTTGSAPMISGDKVVYRDVVGGTARLFCYDLATDASSLLPGCRGADSIDGTTVVYTHTHDRHNDVYAYDLTARTESTVTTGTAWKYDPAISGTKVVYCSPRVYKTRIFYEIYLTDIVKHTTKRLTFRTGTNVLPAISDSNVVYQHENSLGRLDIYLYETKPSASLSAPVRPSPTSHLKHYTVYGTLKPRHIAGSIVGRLQCERYYSGAWHLVKTYQLTSSNHFGYSRYAGVRVRLSHAGKWRIRARHADAGHALSYSRWRSVTVR
jgi:beta propeller repeat protein